MKADAIMRLMLSLVMWASLCMPGHAAITEVSLRKDLGGGVQAEVVSTYLGPGKENDMSWLTPQIKATAGTNLPSLIENRKYRGPVITELFLIQNEKCLLKSTVSTNSMIRRYILREPRMPGIKSQSEKSDRL